MLRTTNTSGHNNILHTFMKVLNSEFVRWTYLVALLTYKVKFVNLQTEKFQSNIWSRQTKRDTDYNLYFLTSDLKSKFLSFSPLLVIKLKARLFCYIEIGVFEQALSQETFPSFCNTFDFVPPRAYVTKAVIWHIPISNEQKIHLYWKCLSDTVIADFNDSVTEWNEDLLLPLINYQIERKRLEIENMSHKFWQNLFRIFLMKSNRV